MKKPKLLFAFMIICSVVLAACRTAKEWIPAHRAEGSGEMYYTLLSANVYITSMFETECSELAFSTGSECLPYSGSCYLAETGDYSWGTPEIYDEFYTGYYGYVDAGTETYINYTAYSDSWYEDAEGNVYENEVSDVAFYFEASYDLDLHACTLSDIAGQLWCEEAVTVHRSAATKEVDNYCKVQVTDWKSTGTGMYLKTESADVRTPTKEDLDAYIADPKNELDPKSKWVGPYFSGKVTLYYDGGSFTIEGITDSNTYSRLMSNPSSYEIGFDKENIPFTYRAIEK